MKKSIVLSLLACSFALATFANNGGGTKPATGDKKECASACKKGGSCCKKGKEEVKPAPAPAPAPEKK